MSIAIYRPYFYIIQHINSGKFYAGVKYGGNANPDQLLKFNGYQTSSNVVKNIILEEGLESFVIRKIRVFETAEEALGYETRFLIRVNASFNDSFLNRCNNSISTLNTDYEKIKQTNLSLYGYECSLQNESVKEKRKQTMIERYGYEWSSQNEDVKEKRKQTMIERYGVTHYSQVPEFQEKRKQTMIERYGASNIFQVPEFLEKQKHTNLGKYGFENVMQSDVTKNKRKQTSFLKNGVSHPSQTPHTKEKIRKTINDLLNRPIVMEIGKYKDKFNLKLGRGWLAKKQEVLETILTELKIIYDIDGPSQILESKEKYNQTCLERFGYGHSSQSPEIKLKISNTRINLINRPVVLEIKKYRDKFKLKLGQNWFCKPQEILDNLLTEFKTTYGEI